MQRWVCLGLLAVAASAPAMAQGTSTPGPLSQLMGMAQRDTGSSDTSVADTTQVRLTAELLQRLAACWTALRQAPDSLQILDPGNDTEPLAIAVAVRGGSPRLAQIGNVINMAALAQRLPAVAAALRRTQFTAATWTAARLALFTAVLTGEEARAMGDTAVTLSGTPPEDVVWQNVTFLRTHMSDLTAVRAAGMWIPPLPHGIIVTQDTVRVSTATPTAHFTVTNRIPKATDVWFALDCGAYSDSAEHDDLLLSAWRHQSACAVPWLGGFPQHVRLAPNERRTFTIAAHSEPTLPAGHYVARMVWAAVIDDGDKLIRHWDFGVTYDRTPQVQSALPPADVHAVPVHVTPATLVFRDSALTATLTVHNPASTPAEVWLAVDCPWFRTNLGGLNSSQFESAWHARIPNVALWVSGYPQHLVMLPHERRTITFTLSPPIVFGDPPGNFYARVVYAQAPRPPGTVVWSPRDTLLHGAVPLVYHHGPSLPLTLQPSRYQAHKDGTAEACVLARQPGLGTIVRLHAEVDDSDGHPVPVRSALRRTAPGWRLDSTVVVWEVVHHNPEDLDHDADPKPPEPVCFAVPPLAPGGVHLVVTVFHDQHGITDRLQMLHATDSLGTVAPGKLADLVLLDANPLADITNTTTIQGVVANGRYYDRATLDRVLNTARTQGCQGVCRTPADSVQPPAP